jgi:hypothetical protein
VHCDRSVASRFYLQNLEVMEKKVERSKNATPKPLQEAAEERWEMGKSSS